MSVESTSELVNEFRNQFSNESGINIQEIVRRNIWGTLGFGYDTGIDIQSAVSTLLKSGKFTVTCPILKGPHNTQRIYLASFIQGRDTAVIFEAPGYEQEKDICSLLGNVHLVREIGKHLTGIAESGPFSVPELPLTSAFSWIAARTAYDTFVPSDLGRSLHKLSKNHTVITNPDLQSFNDKNFIVKTLGTIDERCYFISVHDRLDIFGDFFLAGEVATVFEKDIKKRGGRFYNMLVRDKQGWGCKYTPSTRETAT